MKTKIVLFIKTCVIFLYFSVLAMNCYAAEIENGKWLKKTVKVGDEEYILNILSYGQTIKAKLSEKQGSRSDDPVDFIFYIYNTMRNGNYGEWLKTWDESSLELMDKNYSEQKITPDNFINKWKEIYKSTTEINIVSKIIYNKNNKTYVIFRYYVNNHTNDNDGVLTRTVIVFKDNKWQRTQDLYEDKIRINLEKIISSDDNIVCIN